MNDSGEYGGIVAIEQPVVGKKSSRKKIIVVVSILVGVLALVSVIFFLILPLFKTPKEEAAKMFYEGYGKYMNITSSYGGMISYKPSEDLIPYVSDAGELSPYYMRQSSYSAFMGDTKSFRETLKSLDELSGKVRGAPLGFGSDWKKVSRKISAVLDEMEKNVKLVWSVYEAFVVPMEGMNDSSNTPSSNGACKTQLTDSLLVQELLQSEGALKGVADNYVVTYCDYASYMRSSGYGNTVDVSEYDIYARSIRMAKRSFVDVAEPINILGDTDYWEVYKKIAPVEEN